jgi:pimeloyl-ACP methyl ester carboxylesterase
MYVSVGYRRRAEGTMAVSESLGTRHEIDLPQGRLRYRERGEGPPVVFVPGLMAHADLWRNVVPRIADAGHRCTAPDWPLGAHELPMPGADLSPPGVADLIADLLDALDLRDVTLVANDTGGALTQILLTRRPNRVGGVVLTPCDAFECFFPPLISFLPPSPRCPVRRGCSPRPCAPGGCSACRSPTAG